MNEFNNITISTPANVNSENSFALTQANSFYNPYAIVIKMKAYEINSILFYDKNGVKAKTQSGWFGSNNNIRQIIFNAKKPISRKNKLSFESGSPFIIKSDCDFKTNYDCYIPISDLPKFEVSYTKSFMGIEKYTDIGLPDPKENYIRELVKYFNEGINAKTELEDAIKNLDTYDIGKKSDEEFNSAIQNIINLRQQMKDAYEFEKNYTVEDWKKENGIA